ncbi:hypothetical protein EVAR_99963_1 [Eumeta japonica]|uniref:Uncharacterized protein n=1 Tax=Eumeta variegata TaxID=151549 RepID=A0A4C2A5P1_EUMVA|nr:hypothetical protein EVAR_99963_1 [Eumeta japonica]
MSVHVSQALGKEDSDRNSSDEIGRNPDWGARGPSAPDCSSGPAFSRFTSPILFPRTSLFKLSGQAPVRREGRNCRFPHGTIFAYLSCLTCKLTVKYYKVHENRRGLFVYVNFEIGSNKAARARLQRS